LTTKWKHNNQVLRQLVVDILLAQPMLKGELKNGNRRYASTIGIAWHHKNLSVCDRQ
jgi:hypothetical protein